MKCNFLICSESCSVDMSSNRLSVFNIFDELSVFSFPGFVPMMSICSVFEKEQGDGELVHANTSMTLDSTKLFEIPLPISFHGHEKTRNITNIGGVMFPQPGNYKISISVGDTILSSWPINIPVAPPQVQPDISVPASKKVPAKSVRKSTKK